jgi:hypothetical protein
MKLSQLKPNSSNPRRISETKLQKLKTSIESFEQMMEARPMIINADMEILGGNMRYMALNALGYDEIPDNWVKQMNFTPKQEREFIIKDNVGFGEWDWDILANEWNSVELEDWGMDSWQNMDDIEASDEFSLPNGDKEPFQQMTFTLADQQVEQIKNAIADVKKTEEYKYIETMGNENSNGNALYLIIMQWAEQRK